MSPPLAQLGSYKGMRAQILVELKRSQPRTAKDLAAQLGVSPNAVRHHLKELEAETLVSYGREQRGVGAPTFAYRLTPQGEALFPRRYEETLTELLERVSEQQGREVAVALFVDHYADLTRRLEAELADVSPARRLDVVTRVLSDGGYMAEWNGGPEDNGFRLAEHNCALRAVAERFPEICAAEERFLQRVLAATVERRQHIVGGCNACEYAITFDAPPAPEEHE